MYRNVEFLFLHGLRQNRSVPNLQSPLCKHHILLLSDWSSPMLAGLCRTAHLAYLLKFHACSFSIWTFSVFWSGSEVVFTLSLPLPTFLDRPEWRCAMTVQLKLDARMNEANTPDLSAMEMPTLRRLEKTSLSGLRKHLPKQLEPRTSRYMVHPKTHACPSQPSVQGFKFPIHLGAPLR